MHYHPILFHLPELNPHTNHFVLNRTLPSWPAKLEGKVVGFGSDGASVMVGSRNGVVAMLKADVPYLVDIHCLAHKLDLEPSLL